MFGPPLTGRVTSRIGPRPVMVFGQATAAVGTLVLAFGGHTTPYGALVVGLFLLGVGFGGAGGSIGKAVQIVDGGAGGEVEQVFLFVDHGATMSTRH